MWSGYPNIISLINREYHGNNKVRYGFDWNLGWYHKLAISISQFFDHDVWPVDLYLIYRQAHAWVETGQICGWNHTLRYGHGSKPIVPYFPGWTYIYIYISNLFCSELQGELTHTYWQGDPFIILHLTSCERIGIRIRCKIWKAEKCLEEQQAMRGNMPHVALLALLLL